MDIIKVNISDVTACKLNPSYEYFYSNPLFEQGFINSLGKRCYYSDNSKTFRLYLPFDPNLDSDSCATICEIDGQKYRRWIGDIDKIPILPIKSNSDNDFLDSF